jgi:endo-1,4-beta-xylanase
VQALGIQGHISATPGLSGEAATARASDWRRFLGEVMALDLDLMVTEFDVHDRALPDPIEARDAGVAAAARDWLDATLDAPRLRRLLCWGLADPFSWLQEEPPVRASGAARRPLPFDAALRPKPLRAAIAAALAAAPER